LEKIYLWTRKLFALHFKNTEENTNAKLVQQSILQRWKCSGLWQNSCFWNTSGVIYPNCV